MLYRILNTKTGKFVTDDKGNVFEDSKLLYVHYIAGGLGVRYEIKAVWEDHVAEVVKDIYVCEGDTGEDFQAAISVFKKGDILLIRKTDYEFEVTDILCASTGITMQEFVDDVCGVFGDPVAPEDVKFLSWQINDYMHGGHILSRHL